MLIYDGADNTARTAMESFIKRVNTETGRYSQLVESGSTNPDTRYIVNVDSGAVLDDGTTLTPQQVCWWAGGALAAATYGEDLTNAVYPNAVDISPRLTHSQYVDAINSGKFVLNADDGTVRVEYDINSLVTYTSEIGEVYRYNRTMRLCNTIANDLYSQFSKNYVGIVDNTDAGRMEYKSAVVKYLTQLQASGASRTLMAKPMSPLRRAMPRTRCLSRWRSKRGQHQQDLHHAGCGVRRDFNVFACTGHPERCRRQNHRHS